MADPLFACPQVMVGAAERTVTDGEFDMAEPVEVVRVLNRSGFVALLVLDRVPSLGEGRPHSSGLSEVDDRGAALPVLQMGLPDERSAPAGISKLTDEGGHVRVERSVVEDHAVCRRHASGHDR